FDVNDSFYFTIFSTYKFLVVGAILKHSMTDNKLLNQKIKISKNKIVEYSPITRRLINQTMTVNQLFQASMQGDNTATNIL
ncbi:serine hydrolase, partial [Francisella tularensis subsp. holarctica]|uniref:serine hydrolase n=1 Tax=Francisella tularensis TaxID=263 RepID=UPI002381A54E